VTGEDGQVGASAPADRIEPRPVIAVREMFHGIIVDVVHEEVDLGEAGVVRREKVRHPGVVTIVALDDEGRVALVNQYRNSVRSVLWEFPAGLLDIAGEQPWAAAARELAEEADLRAERWDVLADFLPSPGITDEAARVFLARGLSPVPPGERFVREAEEAAMTLRWEALDDVVAAILDGGLHNPSVVVGALAAFAARARGWTRLRPADAPWLYQPGALPG
jgi:ADP-ribose pyrophosphatase